MTLIKRLADGATFDGTPDQVESLVRSGQGVLAAPTRVYNPKDSAIYEGDPQQATAALQAGGSIEGSHSHKVATTGYLESAARGAAQGATMGFADEIQAGIRAPFSDQSYTQLRDEYRANDAIASEANSKTYGGFEIGGNIASAFVPGLGGLGAARGVGVASKLGRAILTGGALGGVSGAGYSEGDSLGAVAKDALSGAEVGGATGGVLHLGGNALAAAGRGIANSEALNPTVQRLLALGSKTKDFVGPQGDKATRSVQVANRLGLFKSEGHLPPNLEELSARLEQKRVEAADGMSEIFGQLEGTNIPVESTIGQDDIIKLHNVIQNAPPDERGRVAASIKTVMDDIVKSDGDLAQLWQIKKNTGRWVGNDWKLAANRMPSESEAYRVINSALDDTLTTATENIAQTSNNRTLSQLNEQYGAMVTLQGIADKQLGINTTQAATGPFSFRQWVAGLGAGAITGSPAMGVAAASAQKGLGSTQGRLMRAKIGEALHIGEQQQAVAAGAIPRTVAGIKEWVGAHAQIIPPAMRSQIESTLALPDIQAELGIRAMMPMFQQYMAPSPYQSELNGKVSSPEDRHAITTQLQGKGMPASAQALRMSLLNKDGTIPPEVYTSDPAYGDELQDFSKHLINMGY